MASDGKTFLCSYEFEGKQYSLEIPAKTNAEAYLRLRAIGDNGVVDGTLVVSFGVPLSGFFSWLSRFIRGVFNGE